MLLALAPHSTAAADSEQKGQVEQELGATLCDGAIRAAGVSSPAPSPNGWMLDTRGSWLLLKRRHCHLPQYGVCACVLGHFSCDCDPMHCGSPGSSVHGILQGRILEWVAVPSFRDLLDPGIEAMSLMSPELAEGFFTTSATRPLPQYPHIINTQIYDNCG